MDTNKAIKSYGKFYRIALEKAGFRDIENVMTAFENRLREMYASDNFKAHNIYPTTDATYIYAVIAMCLELKSFGYSDPEIIELLNRGFDKRRNRFKKIIAFVFILPSISNIARK